MSRACAPLLIHTDKSKTKEREEEERVRQKSGKEIPQQSSTALQIFG